MERSRRLNRFWHRLITFRVVAETGHLPTAARTLGVTPPALSRTIRLLAEDLGVELFQRRGRRLVLAPAGERLLRSVRDAMRLVDDGVQEIAAGQVRGSVRLAVAGMFTPLALRALARLRAAHPGLVPHLSHDTSGLAQRLLRGDLDLALTNGPQPHPDLETRRLARCDYAVFAGPGHPLHGQSPATDEVCRHPFAAPSGSVAGRAPDHWPAELPRTVQLVLVQVQVALQTCAEGALLVVLPVPVVATSPWRDTLWRLPQPVIEPAWLFSMRRIPLPGSAPTDPLLDAVLAEIGESGLVTTDDVAVPR